MAARRTLWLVLAFAALAVLATARGLTPSVTGLGTHLALGLPPCGFLAWTGLPCPTCGLTTAFAHLAHFELLASLHAHPLGLPMFLAAIALLVLAAWNAGRGTSFARVVEHYNADRWALGFVIALLTTWAARLLALSF